MWNIRTQEVAEIRRQVRTSSKALAALAICGLVGCNISAYKPFNETIAMSHLRKYSTAQAFASVEYGEYIHGLPLLYERIGAHGVMDEPMLNASIRAAKPVPLNGYFFAEIEQDESGARLSNPLRCGLSAFPAIPGRSGDHAFLILMDETVPPQDGGFTEEAPIGSPNIWLYRASVEVVDGPIIRWPSAAELETDFEDLTRSPRL